MTGPSLLTVLRLAASGYRAVIGHSEGGPMGPRNLSSARLVLWILVWVAMSKRRRVRVHIIRELFKTLLAVCWMTRSIPRPIGAGWEFTLSANCSRRFWRDLRSGGADLFACRVLLSGSANGNDGRDRPEDRRHAK